MHVLISVSGKEICTYNKDVYLIWSENLTPPTTAVHDNRMLMKNKPIQKTYSRRL